jgi:hypothetical protein
MKVTLLKPLTLAGNDHAVGERVEVDASTAAWLAGHNVIAPLPATTTGKAAGSKESSAHE